MINPQKNDCVEPFVALQLLPLPVFGHISLQCRLTPRTATCPHCKKCSQHLSSNAGCSGVQNLLAIISTARHSLDLSSFGPSVKHYEDACVAQAMQHTWIRGAARSFFHFAGSWNSRDINDAVSVYKNVILQQKRSEGKNCIHVTMQHNMTKNACFTTRSAPSADAFVVLRCSCPDSCLFPFCAAPAN